MKSICNITVITIILLLYAGNGFAQNAGFTSSKADGCSPLIVTFTSNEQGNGFTHSWDFGNGAGWVNNAPKNPSATYTATGVYTVKHKITGSNGSNTETKTNYVEVYAKPIVSFSGTPLSGCPPLNVKFTNTSTAGTPGAMTHTWVLGTGATPNTSSTKDPSVIYNSGPNNVTLQVTNSNGCVSSVTKNQYVNVLAIPLVNFKADTTDYCGVPVGKTSFTPLISGSAPGPFSYLWEFDFGGTGNPSSTAPAPTYKYTGPAPATYNVRLTVNSSNGCSNRGLKNSYIRLHDPKASFTGPSNVCLNVEEKFTNTGLTAGATYKWDFGDNSPTTATTDGYHTYTTPGTYTVTLTVSIGGCTSTATKQVVVRPKPNPEIVVKPDSLCPAPQMVTLSTNPAMATYKWFIETPTIVQSTLPSPTQVFIQDGFYKVTLQAIDQYGCKDTVVKDSAVRIYPLIVEIKDANGNRAFNPTYSDSGCIPYKVNFRSSVLTLTATGNEPYPYGVKSYFWNFDDGSTSTAANPSHTYTQKGNYKVYLVVTTNNGCIQSDTIFVKAGNKPVSDFEAQPRVICPKENVIFKVLSTGDTPLIYKWTFGDGSPPRTSLDTIENKIYQCTDSFNVTLETSSNGCIDMKTKNAYIVVLAPCAQFYNEADCDNRLKIRFFNTSIGDSSRKWFFGDGGTSTIDDPIHTYATAGTYTIMLTVQNPTTGCSDTVTRDIVVGDNPVDFNTNKTQLCTYDTVRFHSFYTVYPDIIGQLFTYYINGVIVHNNPLPDFSYVFTTPGLYTVKLIAIDNENCPDTVIKTNYITVGRPKAGFTSDTTFTCNPGPITFTDTSTAGPGTTLSWRYWNFGTSPTDVLTTTNTTIVRNYNIVGDFDVYLLVSDNLGCRDSVLIPQYIHSLKPIADYTVKNPVCVGDTVEFGNIATNAVDFNWTFGDGNTSTTPGTVYHTYTTRSNFQSQLIVKDSLGCADTLAKPITTSQPIADFNISNATSPCPPLITEFDGSISTRAKGYIWDFDDGAGLGYKIKSTVVYNNIRSYNIKLIVNDTLGCKDSITKSVQVLGYDGAFEYTPIEGCSPLTVDFTSKLSGSVPTIVWDFGDGNTLLGSSSQPKVTYTYNTPGKYLPKMVLSDNAGCNTSSDGLDTIIVDDVTADFETGPACQYSTVEFINKSTSIDGQLTQQTWTFEDGSFSALKNPKRNYGPPGTYTISLVTSNSRGCIDSIEKDIVINVPIEVNAGDDTIICLTDSTMLTPSGGVSYTWSPGATLSCTNCANPFAFPTVKTVYTVISTDINGCHDTADATIDIKTHVESIVGDGDEICEGETTNLSVSGARTYLWLPSDRVNDATSPAPEVSPIATTNYLVIAYEGSCIPDSNNVEVIVRPKPTVSVRGEQQIVAGSSADLLASGTNIVRFLWEPSNTLSCDDCADPVASPFKTTIYTVKVFTKYECVDSAKAKISVLCDKSQLYVPNTFTPNGDGMNDVFMVRGTGINTLKSFKVFNRWGEVMFERENVDVNDKTNGWDGNYNGVQLPPDVYVYMVEAYCENGELLKLKGDITIIR